MAQRMISLCFAANIFILLTLTKQEKTHVDETRDLRIIHGEDAKKHEFPWMVMLTDPSGEQFCGGSLISEDFVLTAAHCMYGDPEWNPTAVKVKLGAFNKSEIEPESFFVGIRRILRHPNYVTDGVISDITLLELVEKVPFSEAVTPICIPSEEDTFTGVLATIAGWGLTSEGPTIMPRRLRETIEENPVIERRRRKTGEPGEKSPAAGGIGSDVLQKAEVPVLSQQECKEIYGEDEITDDMLCAGGQGKDTCQKDSGGPIMFNEPLSGWVLVGVTSWGKGCGKAPGVFSRVSFASPWIRKNVQEPSLCLR